VAGVTQTRRQFLAATAAAGAAVAVGACGGGDEQPSGGGGGGGRQTGQITFTTWGSAAEIGVIRALIRDFEAANRGARVRLREVPFEEVRAAIDADLEAGNAPDLFRVTYQDFGFYATNGALVDLSAILPPDYGEGFTPGFWQAVQFEDKPHGVPWHTDVSALVYNREVFQRAGITSVPDRLEDAWTWDEFLQVARQVRDRGGRRVSAFGMNWQEAGAFRWLNWLYAAGGRMVNEDFTQATLEGSPEALRTLEYFQTWFEEELTPRNMTPRGAYPSEVFPAQRLGMISVGDFLLPTFDESITRFEYGATFLPRDRGAATDLGGTAIVATRDSDLPELAGAFAQFMGEERNQRRFIEATTTLPTRSALVEADLAYEVAADLMPVFQQQATTLGPELVQASTLPNFTEINSTFVEQLEALTARGQAPDETLRNLQAGVTEALQA